MQNLVRAVCQFDCIVYTKSPVNNPIDQQRQQLTGRNWPVVATPEMEMRANEISFNYSRQVAAAQLVTHFAHKRVRDGATKHGKWGRQLLKCLPDCLSAWLVTRGSSPFPTGRMLDWPAFLPLSSHILAPLPDPVSVSFRHSPLTTAACNVPGT